MPEDLTLLIAEPDCPVGASLKEYAEKNKIGFVSVRLDDYGERSSSDYNDLLVRMADGVLIIWDGESQECVEINSLAYKRNTPCPHMIFPKTDNKG